MKLNIKRGEGVRPFLFLFLVFLLLLSFYPSKASAAIEVIELDDFYGIVLPAGTTGMYSFRSSAGGGSYTFPSKVSHISWTRNTSNTDVKLICTAAGIDYEAKPGTLGTAIDPPAQTIKCRGNATKDLGNISYITSVVTTDGKTYKFIGSGDTTPKPGDPALDGGVFPNGGTNGGDTGGDGGTKPDPGGGNTIGSSSYYASFRDEYRVDYNPPAGAASYGLYFTSSSGTPHSAEYNFPPTGIHYLNCNGTYVIKFYDSAGKVIGETKQIVTSAIKVPACQSYADGVTGNNDLGATWDGEKIKWNDTGADKYEVWKDGKKVGETTDKEYATKEPGSYSVLGVKNDVVTGQSDLKINGTDNGGTDPPDPGTDPGGSCGDVCEQLSNLLKCPGWDELLGDFESIMPKPPDWNQVAGIFKDKIVPAMGQEIVNRSPEIAKIIADEFESREKPVQAPRPLPDFKPNLPQLNDMWVPVKQDMNKNVPDFTPDYSGSKPFQIPDPMALTYDNRDKGYEMPKTQDLSSPDYKKTERIEPDKGYKTQQPDSVTPPSYQVNNPINNKPMPDYKTEQKTDKPPDYHVEDKPAPNYQFDEKPMPEYKGR